LGIATVILLSGWSGPSAETLPRMASDAVWNQEITSAPLHADSATMIATLTSLGGFGFGRMQIDFSLHVVRAAPGAPTRTIVSHPDGYFAPDCEPVGTSLPVPLDATIEGQTTLGDITCANTDEDCHLLVVQGSTLYEAYAATASGSGSLESLCLAIWHLDATYPAEGRGEHCTSADAAGFPIAPLLFNADEIAASLATDPTGGGDLGHAIRFILPNERMANDISLGGVGGRLYVHPATHAGSPSGPVASVPYGARLRLSPAFPLTGYPAAARVILNTMKRYGIVLADGGSIALTAESDLYTTTSWADLGLGPHVFWDTPSTTPVTVSDLEVLDTGPRIGETWDCVRTDIVAGQVLRDGFETGDVGLWSGSVP
jgi:serine/threonine-protein kinase